MSSDSGGETIVGRAIRIVLLTATITVAASALIRPIVAFVDAPAKQLRLPSGGKMTTLSLSHEIEIAPQPWQVNPNKLMTIKKYTYTGIGVQPDQEPETLSLYLQVTGSSARSGRAYVENRPETYLESGDDHACPNTLAEQEVSIKLQNIEPYSKDKNKILWLLGSRPYDQKVCLLKNERSNQ